MTRTWTPRLAVVTTNDTLRIDRRLAPRRRLDGSVVAIRTAGARFGRVHRLTDVDCSGTGVGACSEEPIELGQSVLVGFERDGAPRRGTVCRCARDGDVFRVGIRFDQALAA